MNTIHCNKCDQDKTPDDFYRSRGVLVKPCKECRKAIQRKVNKEAYVPVVRVSKAKGYVSLARAIRDEAHDRLYVEQDGLCAICKSELIEFGSKTCVDHVQGTDIVRGLLCNQCNVGLGMFKDSVEVLQGAITYLERYRMIDGERSV